MIDPVGGHCGMDCYDFGLARGLAAAGANVVVYTSDETALPKQAPFGVRHSYRGIYTADPTWRRSLRFARGTLDALIHAVREKRRIVHFHLFHVGAPEFFDVVLARLLGRKVVITAHDVESFVGALENRWMRWLVYRLAHRVVAHNDISKRELIAHVGVEEGRIRLIRHGNYLGLVPELPASGTARQRCDVPAGARVILYFGQIKEVKGVDLLIRAMPAVIARCPDVVLLLAGKTWKTDFSVYQNLMNDLGIATFCRVHNRFIPPEELPFFFAAADVIVLPYRRIYQSGVALLAMSYGKPVIASNLPGFTEVIEDGISGYIFESDNPASLSDRLNFALSDRGGLEKTGRAALRRVAEHYDWNHSGRDTVRLYEEIL